MRIAFVTCSAHADGRPDDAEVAALVGGEFAVWNDPAVDWHAYDRVVIRSVWDYSQQVDEFLAWCDDVGEQRLRNRPSLVRFNSDKRYLAVLDAPTAPTTFLEPGQTVPAYQTEIVIKPNISAGARDTGRFQPDAADQAAELVRTIHASGRTALIQPYLPAVDSEGETAIVFFGDDFSHALHKRPVLREAGIAPLAQGAHSPAAVMLEADLVGPGEATAAQLRLAHAVHAEVSDRFGQPVYARIDIASDQSGEPVLMELELIEPRLYLEFAPGSVQRFAAAVVV